MATTAAGTPYVESSDLVANYPGVSLALANHIDDTAAKVLQVVSVVYSTSTSTSSTSFVTTGLAASITPSLSSSKVLIIASIPLTVPTSMSLATTIFRGTAAGTNLGTASYGFGQTYSVSGRLDATTTMNFLDSPATASSQTYTLGFRVNTGTGTVQAFGAMSSLTLMEIGA